MVARGATRYDISWKHKHWQILGCILDEKNCEDGTKQNGDYRQEQYFKNNTVTGD